MEIRAVTQDDFTAWVGFMDASVLMRHVGLAELEAVRSAALVRRYDPGGAGLTERMDATEAARLLGRAAVRGWRGLTLDGAEFAYTPGRCDALMTRWGAFARFVAEASADIGRMEAAIREDASKKPSLTSGPGSTSRA
jgi:hypothetical protein